MNSNVYPYAYNPPGYWPAPGGYEPQISRSLSATTSGSSSSKDKANIKTTPSPPRATAASTAPRTNVFHSNQPINPPYVPLARAYPPAPAPSYGVGYQYNHLSSPPQPPQWQMPSSAPVPVFFSAPQTFPPHIQPLPDPERPFHFCGLCGNPRSRNYHRNNPLIPGQPKIVSVCRRCTRKSVYEVKEERPQEVRAKKTEKVAERKKRESIRPARSPPRQHYTIIRRRRSSATKRASPPPSSTHRRIVIREERNDGGSDKEDNSTPERAPRRRTNTSAKRSVTPPERLSRVDSVHQDTSQHHRRYSSYTATDQSQPVRHLSKDAALEAIKSYRGLGPKETSHHGPYEHELRDRRISISPVPRHPQYRTNAPPSRSPSPLPVPHDRARETVRVRERVYSSRPDDEMPPAAPQKTAGPPGRTASIRRAPSTDRAIRVQGPIPAPRSPTPSPPIKVRGILRPYSPEGEYVSSFGSNKATYGGNRVQFTARRRNHAVASDEDAEDGRGRPARARYRHTSGGDAHYESMEHYSSLADGRKHEHDIYAQKDSQIGPKSEVYHNSPPIPGFRYVRSRSRHAPSPPSPHRTPPDSTSEEAGHRGRSPSPTVTLVRDASPEPVFNLSIWDGEEYAAEKGGGERKDMGSVERHSFTDDSTLHSDRTDSKSDRGYGVKAKKTEWKDV